MHTMDIAITAIIGALLIALLVWWSVYGRRKLPPGPWSWPIVGRMDILDPDLCYTLQHMGREYGDMCSFYIGTRLTVILNSARSIRAALIDQGVTFANRPYPWVMKLVDVKEELNNGQYTDEWKVDRKFVLNAMRQFGYGSKSLEDKIVTELNTLMDNYRSLDSKAFNPRTNMPKTMANLIFSILINQTYDYDSPQLKELLSLIHEWQENVGEANLLDIFPLLRWFPWKPMKKLKVARDRICALYEKFVLEHKQTYSDDNSRDVIDVYLKERGRDYDTTKLVGLFFSFAGDAVDSLPESMVWTVLYLASDPEIQNKIYAEIIQFVGDGKKPSLADRPNMVYTEAFIMESLRMCSFVPISEPHRPLQSTQLLGYDIPEESNVLANLYAAHFDPDYWEDPNTFRPERFIDDSGAIIRHDAFMPYGLGRRMCVGEQLANKVLFLFVTYLVQEFVIKADTDNPLPTLQPQRWYVRKAQEFTVRLDNRN